MVGRWSILAINVLYAQCLEDANEFCAEWAAAGACTANPSYMEKNCMLSCKGSSASAMPVSGGVQSSVSKVSNDAGSKLDEFVQPTAASRAGGISLKETSRGSLVPESAVTMRMRAFLFHYFGTDLTTHGLQLLALGLAAACACLILRKHMHRRPSLADAANMDRVACQQGSCGVTGGTGEAGGQSCEILHLDKPDACGDVPGIRDSRASVVQELEKSLAAEGKSLQSVREDLEQLRSRLKAQDVSLLERENTLQLNERRVTANSVALKEQAGRQEQEVARLIKRSDDLEAELRKFQSDAQAEREAFGKQVRELHGQLEAQRKDANKRIMELESQRDAALKLANDNTDSRVKDMQQQMECQRRDANARILELEKDHDVACEEIRKLREQLTEAETETSRARASEQEHAARIATRSAELDKLSSRLHAQALEVEDRERRGAAEAVAVRGQADSQRQAYFQLVEEVTSLRAELGPLREDAARVKALQEELRRRSLSLDAREEELGNLAREQFARARKDEAEIVALRSQAGAQTDSHMRLLEENAALRKQLADLDASSCHVRKCE
eukprot:TRINITY_DN24948_c0_g2_i1.p1 TRINITY_DN24948_c0_g2~~TRINITY_DN24948_c0_g2_i1.p1  ORF type:complete len:562 (+),score=110.03 TRINITY_DN24948_c0_g2_i1:141-1826(+)